MDFEQDIKNCMIAMQSHGVILYPTDTVWGLGCDATDAVAVQKIYDIKQRDAAKSMIILLAEARDVLQYVAAPPHDIISILENFERPTTVIYYGALGLAEGVAADDGSIGIRVTKDPFCKALIKRLRKPLVSTSANISGMPAPALYKDIWDAIKNHVDYTVQFRQDDMTVHKPSRLVKIDDEGGFVVVRE